MKKLIICSYIVLLSGCSLWMASYDSNEYMLVNKVRTQAQIGSCDKSDVNILYTDATQLKNFAQYIPRNQATIDLTSKLYTLVDELRKRENPSPAYCKNKLNIISISAEEIQRVVGSKPR